jgi:molybdenum cofactor cytidylyltransferase
MAPEQVSAIVLAAGESRRMGSLKPLLPFGSGSVIQSVVRSLKASPAGRVLVVLGHQADEIAAHLAGEGVEVVRNPRYREGMLSSVQAGVSAAPPGTEWLVIALGDQPSLQPAVVRVLLQRAEAGLRSGYSIVVPSYGGRRGHPLVIHARHREEIGHLDPQVGLRELMQSHAAAILHVDMESDDVLRDIDTPEEYQRELRYRERQS